MDFMYNGEIVVEQVSAGCGAHIIYRLRVSHLTSVMNPILGSNARSSKDSPGSTDKGPH